MNPGSRLGHYDILEPLGAGGMGEVYRARDTRLGREVAIKILPEGLGRDPERLARFEREARTVAALNHPNVVTLFSFEQDGDTRFLAMELVRGRGLEHEVTPGGLPAERVVELGVAVAEALAAAHARGIVHRDLKPANVMVTADGHVKVLDFGLARFDAAGGDSSDTELATAVAVSTPGQVMGTAPYMAPEQVRGEAADARTDLFALGTVLYELATGQRPFQGNTIGLISSAILNEVPRPPASLVRELPAELDRIISRCLEKDPGARFQSAADLASALRRVGSESERDSGVLLKVPPEPSTPLLGREQDLAAAIEQIEAGASVLTVTGYGGTGKTRFAIELFRRLAPRYPGGAAFVSLASVTSAGDVLPTIAATLDIAESHDRSALEGVSAVIAGREVLLVLDNLEQVLDAAGDLATLASRCPRLQIVATSRAPLKIGAEHEFSLPPLALPVGEKVPVQALLEVPAVALFVQRAARVKSGFRLTEENAPAVTAICRRLDGLPLALELAAARVRILDPQSLLQRLDHALDLLTSGDRDLPLRQRTLRTTISWSYSLLEPSEQRLLRRCSVFHEGWTFEAMERVCYGDEDRFLALDELESLVEKGLVRVIGGGERYSLLETIRAFAAEQLHAGGEVERMRDAHAAHFVSFLEEAARQFRTVQQVEAAARVRADNANEMAALHWLMGKARAGDAEAREQALLLTGCLDWFWHIAGTHLTAETVLDELLPQTEAAGPSRARALARLCAGMIYVHLGDWDRGLDGWRGGYEDGNALGDEELACEGLAGMGYTYLSSDRPEQAVAPLAEGVQRCAAASEFLQGLLAAMQGMLKFGGGDHDAGMAQVQAALRVQRRIGDCECGGIAASFLGQMYFTLGDLQQSRSYYDESLVMFDAVGDRPEMARVFCETGWTALAGDDVDAARRAFCRGVQIYEEVGSPRGTSLALLGLAAADAAEGLDERAVTIAEASSALAQRAGVVCDHAMAPGLSERIEELKRSIPSKAVEGIVAEASTLTPAAVLAMLQAPAAVV